MASRVIFKTVANALIPDARLTPGASWLLNWNTFGMGAATLQNVERRMGGLWIGGTLIVAEDGVRFEPNELNQVLQEGKLATELQCSELTGVHVRPGLFTNIIEVSAGDRMQAFRCFGAKRIASEIDGAWKAATIQRSGFHP